MKKVLLVVLAFAFFLSSFTFGQTNPTAQSLPLNQNFNAMGSTAILPSGFAAWLNPYKSSKANAESSVPTADAPIVQVSTVQSSGASVYNYNTPAGSPTNSRLYVQVTSNVNNGSNIIACAINTTGQTNITVAYDIEMINQAVSRVSGASLQYRVGTSGGWTTVANTDYSGGTDVNGTIQHFSATLPSGAENQSVVQLRWITYEVGTASGSRDGIALDNVAISGSAASSPNISTSASSLLPFLQSSASASAEQSYTVSGSNLSADVTVTAPAGYEVSTTTGSGFAGSVVLAQSGGSLTGQPVTIYVRLNAGSFGSFSGNITHASTGATTQNVAVSGVRTIQYYSKATGNLDVVGNWGTGNDGSGTNPADFTSGGQIFNIVNQANPTLGSGWTVSGIGSKIILGNGTDAINFTIPSGSPLTGTIDLAANSTLTINDNTPPTFGTINSTSTIDFASSGTVVIPVASYGNLKLSNGTKTFSAGTTNILGNLTVSGVTGFNGSVSPFSTVNLSGNLTLLGTVTAGAVANGMTLVCLGSSGVQTITGNGNPVQLFRLTVNNSAGVVLSTTGGSSNFNVGNTSGGGVTMTLGNLTTNSNVITLYNSTGSSVLNEAAGKYVIGNVSVTKAVASAASSTFGGIGLTLAAAAEDLGNVTVTRVTGSHVTLNGNTGINRIYSINPTNALTLARDLTFTWLSDDDNAKTLTSMQVYKSTDNFATVGNTSMLGASVDGSTRSLMVSLPSLSSGVNSAFTVAQADQPLLPLTPTAPVAISATNILQTSFSAKWNLSSGATTYLVDVSTDTTFATLLTGFPKDAGNADSTVVTGLTAATKYFYRVRASNSSGTSDNSNVISLLTLPNAPVAPVASAATSITSSGFTANWNASAGATKYFLDVSSLNDFSTLESGYNNKDVGNVTTFSVTGLTPATPYYYRLRAYNSGGASGNSNTISVSTNPGVPGAPVAIAATSITTTGFTANWNSVGGASTYLLDVSSDSTFTTLLTGFPLDAGNVTSSVVTGLTSSTKYYYQVRASNITGSSGNSNTITVTTNPPVPSAPVATAATLISTTGFTANWNSATGATKYLLDVSADSNFTSLLTGFPLDAGTSTSSAITGLTSSTKYYYRVRASNAGGTSGNSNRITVTTNSSGGQTLAAGDLAILGVNSDDPDAFAFVPLVDLQAGTIIRFTDSGVKADGTFRGGEGAVKYTTPAGGISAGTIISYSSPATGNFATDNDATVGTNGLSLSTSGDQIIAFQGVSTTPTFLYAVTTLSNSWAIEATSSNNSALPLGLTNGTSAIAVGGASADNDDAVYNMSITIGTKSDLLTAIGTYANWTTSQTALSMPSGTLTIGTPSIPSSPVANTATNITSSSFSANWGSVSGASKYFLDVSTSNSFSTFLTGFDNLDVSNVTTYSVTSLIASTPYYYRVRAYNSAGTSGNSNTVSVTTSAPPASNTIVQFQAASGAVNESAGTYNLVFTITNPDATNATTFQVALTGGTGSSADVNSYTTQTVTFPAGSSTNQNVTLSVTNDGVVEGNETLVFSIQNISGGNSAAVGTYNQFTLTVSDPVSGYYTGINSSLTGTAMHNQLHNLIKTQTKYPYTDAGTDVWKMLQAADEDPANSSNVKLIYSQYSYAKTNNGGNAGQWNREHIWAQSRGGFDTSPGPGTDAHHLRAEDVTVNSVRGNKDFDNGGTAYPGLPNIKYTTNTWEPPDNVKGDIARMLFYMDVRYDADITGEPDLQVVEQINGAVGTIGKLSTLLAWSQADPPDADEVHRNDVVYSYQNNRNPFIDHPEWVSAIWGGGGGTAPSITSITRDVKVPNANQNTVVNASISDDGTISAAQLLYTVDSGSEQSVDMSVVSGTTYSAAIPESAYNNGNLLKYRVRATDNNSNTTTSDYSNVFTGVTNISTLHAVNADGTLQYNGLYAKISGVATVGGGTYSPTNLETNLQDATGGITIFKSSAGATTFTLGNNYTILGVITFYNGLLEFVPDDASTDIVDGGAGTLPTPLVKTITELMASPETYESQLVKIPNVSVTSGTWGANQTLNITDGVSNLVTLRIDGDTDVDENAQPTWPKDVIGIFTQFDSTSPYADGYQIKPRSFTDANGGVAGSTIVQFASITGNTTEAIGTFNLTLKIQNPNATQATTLQVALIGGTGNAADVNNYTTQTVTFPAGSSANQVITLTVPNDGIVEPNETLIFVIQNVTGGTTAAVGANSQFTLTITAPASEYYAGINTSLSGAGLKLALHNLIKGQQQFPYTASTTDVWDILMDAWEDPTNPSNVLLVYSGRSEPKVHNQGVTGTTDQSAWNREHVFAQSRGGFDTSPGPGTDCHHMAPEAASVNTYRSNRDFDNGGTTVPGTTGCKYDADSWEPRDDMKGDIARMLLYMDTRYEGDNGELQLGLVDYTTTSYTAGTIGKLSTLLAWSHQDPPDAFEQSRNNKVYSYQGNRNPFIDHPEWVEKIYGAYTGLLISNVNRAVNVPDENQNLVVNADIVDDGSVSSATLIYKINNGSDVSVSMVHGAGNTYSGTIPESVFGNGTLVSYKIKAVDNSANTAETVYSSVLTGVTPILTLTKTNPNGSLVYNGIYAKVNGVATVSSNVFNASSLEVNIQDATAGVTVYKVAETRTFTASKNYTVIGSLTQYNGLAELIPDNITTDIIDNGAGTAPNPVVKSMAEVLLNPELYEGRLIKINNLKKVSGTWGPSQTLVVTDGNSSDITLRISSATDISGNAEPTWPQDIVGILVQFDSSSPYSSGYQLKPRAFTDFSNATVPSPLLVSPANGAQKVLSSISFEWKMVNGIDFYELQVSTSAGFGSVDFSFPNLTKYFQGVNGLAGSTTYYWRVRTKNGAVYSGWSDVYSFTTVADIPGKPTLVSPSNNSKLQPTNAKLKWVGMLSVDKYKLLVSEKEDFSTSVISNDSLKTSEFQNSGLKNGTKYFWKVSAANLSGTGPSSDVWNFTTVDTLLVPSELAGVADTSYKVNLSWKDNSGNETGFKVERSGPTTETFAEIISLAANTTAYRDTSVLQGKTYKYRVRSFNAEAASNYSSVVSVTIPIAAIKPPSNILAKPNSSGGLDITWQDNSNNEKGFRIERQDGGNSFSIKNDVSQSTEAYVFVANVAANVMKYTDTQIKEGSTYSYRVIAFNDDGISIPNATAQPVVPLNAPTNLSSVIESGKQARIKWTNTSASAEGAEIFRAIKKTDLFGSLYKGKIASPEYVDSTIFDGRKYYYKVSVYSGVNGISAFSNIDSVFMSMKAPTNIKIEQLLNQNKIKISWKDNSKGEDGYVIERKSLSEVRYAELTRTSANAESFTDQTVTNKSNYTYRVKGFNDVTESDYTSEGSVTVGITRLSEIPEGFKISQNYPNPFNPATKISYSIAQRCNVRIQIYDMLGQLVTDLVNREQEPGVYEAEFRANNLSSGTYFYIFEAGGFREIRKLILLK